MDFTLELCKAYNLSPFVVMKQDKDEVIMLINYFVEKGQNGTNEIPKQPAKKDDGFWDF